MTTTHLQRLSYYLLPVLYLSIGGVVTAMLLQRILHYANTTWLVLLLPMLMITVLLTVVGIVNVWLHYRTWSDKNVLRQYSQRSLLWLYVRCWAVVMAGLMLGLTFAWTIQMLPDYLRELVDDMSAFFYAVCVFLTIMALMSIVVGENLHEIRLRNAQTENQLLKAQLNPHFLYNTLNNIDALIWLDQERASAAVTSLSSLMRYMTYSSRQEQVPVADEARTIMQLCELQRLRMGKPASLRADIGDDVMQTTLTVAPLLLIPLVENCFKHCGDTTQTDAIRLSLTLDDRRLTFCTDNNMKTAADETSATAIRDTTRSTARPSSPQHGVGLTVLRRRLELLYPDRYTFSAGRQDDGRFRTTLTIDC